MECRISCRLSHDMWIRDNFTPITSYEMHQRSTSIGSCWFWIQLNYWGEQFLQILLRKQLSSDRAGENQRLVLRIDCRYSQCHCVIPGLTFNSALQPDNMHLYSACNIVHRQSLMRWVVVGDHIVSSWSFGYGFCNLAWNWTWS